MNCVSSNPDTPRDRIRYVLKRVSQAEVSWTGRELFFLVKTFFPVETRSRVGAAAATLCSSGEFFITGRRYQTKAQTP
jgi:hypothetical protein